MSPSPEPTTTSAKRAFVGWPQRSAKFIELRERLQEAVAEVHRSVAELERAIGGPLSEMAGRMDEEIPAPAGRREIPSSRD